MTSSLRDKTISGAFWSFIQNFGAKGVGIFTTIILARLLMPKDFGLIGMLSVFISVSQGIAEGGFNQALIQKKGADDEDYSSVFYINLIVSLFLYMVMYFGAPWIADFYGQPLLIKMARVLSLVFIINAFSYVQKSRLAKQLQFKKLMLIHLPSIIISAIVAIIMAYEGYGVWSLIAQQLVMRFVYAVQIWIHAKWKPLWTFNKKKAKGLFSFGSRLMISAILNKIFQNLYLVVIGRFFPVETLGYYKSANNLTRTPSDTLSSAIKTVTFPVFSSVQEDNVRLKRGYKKTIQQVFFWVCPLMVLAAVMATPLFRFILTDKWLPAVPFFRILCIIGIIKPLSSFNLDVVTVKGRSDLYLRLNIIKKVIISIGVALSIPYGIWALMGFQAFNLFFEYIINSYYSGRFIDYPMREQLKDILPVILISFSLGFLIYMLDYLFMSNWPDVLRLVLSFIFGIGIYLLVAREIKYAAFIDIKEIIQSRGMRLMKR